MKIEDIENGNESSFALLFILIHDFYCFSNDEDYTIIGIHYEGYGKGLGCNINGYIIPKHKYYKKYIVKKFKNE